MKRTVIAFFVAGLVLSGCTHNEVAPQSVASPEGKTAVFGPCVTGPIPQYEKFNDGIGVPACNVSQAATSKTKPPARSITLWVACYGSVGYIEYVVTDRNGNNGEVHTHTTPDHKKWSILTTQVPCNSTIVLTPTGGGNELVIQCAGHTWQTNSTGNPTAKPIPYNDVQWK